MALAECKVLAALLSLVAALLFLVADALPFHHHHGSSCLRGPGAALADLLVAALDRLRGVDVVELATRRNMVLLCHAILLLVLRDAGLLGAPARRRRSAGAAATTGDIFVAAAAASCYSPTERSLAVAWRPRHRGDTCRFRRQRRGTRMAEEDPCATPSSLTEAEHGAAQHESTKDIVLVEQRQPTYLDDARIVAVAGDLDQPAAVDFGTPIVDVEGNRAEEEDLDEMNRRFEAFIADTKEKMRLEEARQPAHVPGINRQVLTAY